MVRTVMRARGMDASGRPSGSAEAHRMVLGALTSGLAHELNNPLAAVIANLDLATRQVDEQVRAVSSYSWLDDLNAELQDARDAADMLHGIVKRLRPLGPRAPSRDDTDLSSVLEASMALLGRELRRRGRLRHPAPVNDKVVIRPSCTCGPRARPARVGLSRPCSRMTRRTRSRPALMPIGRRRAWVLR